MKSNQHTPAWKSLGFSKEHLDSEHKFTPVNLALWWCDSPPVQEPNKDYRDAPDGTGGLGPTALDATESWVSSVLSNGRSVFALGWMGYPHHESPLSNWREAGRRVVSSSLHYFFGPWRERFVWYHDSCIGYAPFNREQARTRLPWSNAYRAGLALACAFGDWPAVDRFLEWPAPDLCRDEGTDDRTAEDNAYQIWLAMQLRSEPEEKTGSQRELAQQPKRREGDFEALKAFRKVKDVLPGVEAIASAAIQREMIERASRRRPKMLLAAADAMLAGNTTEFSKSLTAYLKHYRQRELQLQRVDTGISLDGMVLWHLARRRGMGEVSLPEDVMMLIARP